MLNNVKNEYNEVKAQLAIKVDAEMQTDGSTASIQDVKKEAQEKGPIKLKIEETVSAVTHKVAELMTPKKKEPVVSVSEATSKISKEKEEKEKEEKEIDETEEKIGEKKLPKAN
jgi:hypothetical protein